MKPEPTTVTVSLSGGKTISFETGKLAKQAHGSAVVRIGDNVVLATATSNRRPARRHRFLPAHRRLPRIHLCRRTFPRRLHQARRPHERARSAHQPADRSPGASAVRRRIQVRDAGHRVCALRRHRIMIPTFAASTAPRPRCTFPTFRSSARLARCAWAWSTDSSWSIPPTTRCAKACSTSWSSARQTAS